MTIDSSFVSLSFTFHRSHSFNITERKIRVKYAVFLCRYLSFYCRTIYILTLYHLNKRTFVFAGNLYEL